MLKKNKLMTNRMSDVSQTHNDNNLQSCCESKSCLHTILETQNVPKQHCRHSLRGRSNPVPAALGLTSANASMASEEHDHVCLRQHQRQESPDQSGGRGASATMSDEEVMKRMKARHG